MSDDLRKGGVYTTRDMVVDYCVQSGSRKLTHL